jgi:hypothetical protein
MQVYKMVIKISKFSFPNPSKICQNLSNWNEKIPSGNPAPYFKIKVEDRLKKN